MKHQNLTIISVLTDGHKHYEACVVETRPHADTVESADAVDIQGRSVSCLFIFIVSVIGRVSLARENEAGGSCGKEVHILHFNI